MASGNDMKAHASTYDGFITLIKVSIPVLTVIAILVMTLITK